jgi:NADPH:quinone reductase-like Zn-dependent oxidoreductase
VASSRRRISAHEHQVEMMLALESADFRPVIDRVFPLAQTADAFAHQAAQKHFGKICLSV